jgi:hypothetical protein
MKEITLAVALAVMGFLFSTHEMILFLNDLIPLQGLLVYYVIVYLALFILSRMDLVIFGFKIKTVMQTVGLTIITFAFFITVNWTSPYVQYVTTGSVQGASNIFYQSEDGAIWYLWSLLLPTVGVEVVRILTYVVSPFLLALLGGLLVSGRIRMGGP